MEVKQSTNHDLPLLVYLVLYQNSSFVSFADGESLGLSKLRERNITLQLCGLMCAVTSSIDVFACKRNYGSISCVEPSGRELFIFGNKSIHGVLI